MFERYTGSARRVIFFARHHASQDADTCIRCVHLLAGLEREAPRILREAGLSSEHVTQIQDSIVSAFGTRGQITPTSVEMPLDEKAHRALKLAFEFAASLEVPQVTPVHVLGGLFEADPELRAELEKAGVTQPKLRALAERYAREDEQAGESFLTGLEARVTGTRAGIGYDLHRLEAGRKLFLGGVEVPFDKGPVGHSDGDVLSHAICDALLGAAGLGDIGTHFPDTDAKWKGAASRVFLEHARKLLEERGLSITHIDAVVVAERPKLGPHFPAMRQALAGPLGIQPDQINLKAKTHEGLGEIGRGEAIAAHAIVTLER